MFDAVRRLPVHRSSVAFILEVDKLMERLPRERRYLRDQIRRAALSILLNLREGAAETRPREKARFYRLAKRSAAEAGAGLEMLGLFMPALKAETDALDREAERLTLELHRLSLTWLRTARTAKRRKK